MINILLLALLVILYGLKDYDIQKGLSVVNTEESAGYFNHSKARVVGMR